MSNLFSIDSPFWQKVSKITLVIWMNVLWLLTCIPIVTIGASTTAYYRMLFNIRQEKTANLREFFLAFFSNFKQATILWLIQLAAAVLLIALAWFLFAVTSNAARVILLVFFLALLFISALAFVYVPALTAYFYNSVSGTLLNSLAMGIRHYHQTIPGLVLTMLPAAVLLFFPYYFLLWLPLFITFGTSATTYGIMLLLERVFLNYTPQ